MRGKIPGGTGPASWPHFSRGRNSSKNLIISIYNCYIHILLIKTNSMIYICYIFCKEGVEICVLTVRDNEHDSEHGVGDDEVTCRMLPRVRQRGNGQGDDLATEPNFRKVGNGREKLGTLGPRHPCIFTGEYW
jgi:hypothetical protein